MWTIFAGVAQNVALYAANVIR